MKTLLYANRAEPKSISVIYKLLLAAAGDITKLRCMHRECYIFASQNLCYLYNYEYFIHSNFFAGFMVSEIPRVSVFGHCPYSVTFPY